MTELVEIHTAPRNAPRAPTADLTVRGILILAVVFGHDRLLFETVPFYFAAIYFWHVQGFFFLAYGRRGDVADVSVIDQMVRYLTPFLVFVGALSIAKLVLSGVTTAHVSDAALAIVIGSARLVDVATGMALFWFLPALAGFSATMILLARVRRRWPAFAWLSIAVPVLWFGITLALPASLLDFLPLGLGLVGYLLTLAMVHRACLALLDGTSASAIKAILWVAVTLTLVVEGITIARGNVVNVSVFDFAKPNDMRLALLNAAATVAANIVVFRVARLLLAVRPLQVIGARSLDIFLFHQFFLYPITLLVHAMLPGLTPAAIVMTGIGAALVAVALALLASVILDRMPALRRLIFPKDLAALRQCWASVFQRADRTGEPEKG